MPPITATMPYIIYIGSRGFNKMITREKAPKRILIKYLRGLMCTFTSSDDMLKIAMGIDTEQIMRISVVISVVGDQTSRSCQVKNEKQIKNSGRPILIDSQHTVMNLSCAILEAAAQATATGGVIAESVDIQNTKK